MLPLTEEQIQDVLDAIVKADGTEASTLGPIGAEFGRRYNISEERMIEMVINSWVKALGEGWDGDKEYIDWQVRRRFR